MQTDPQAQGLRARVRWGNVARALALVLVAALVVAWPRLRSQPPEVPPGAAVPLREAPVAPPPVRAPGTASAPAPAPAPRAAAEPATARTRERPRRERPRRRSRSRPVTAAKRRAPAPAPAAQPAPVPAPAPRALPAAEEFGVE
jgi:hypothetical protein